MTRKRKCIRATHLRGSPFHSFLGTELKTLTKRRRFFSYFTHLSYIGLIAYMYAAGVQTLCYALNRRKGYPLQQWPRPLQHLHKLLYSTVTTYREPSRFNKIVGHSSTKLRNSHGSHCHILGTAGGLGHVLDHTER